MRLKQRFARSAQHDQMFRVVAFDDRQSTARIEGERFDERQTPSPVETPAGLGQAEFAGEKRGDPDHSDDGGERGKDAEEFCGGHDASLISHFVQTKNTTVMFKRRLSSTRRVGAVKRCELSEGQNFTAEGFLIPA